VSGPTLSLWHPWFTSDRNCSGSVDSIDYMDIQLAGRTARRVENTDRAASCAAESYDLDWLRYIFDLSGRAGQVVTPHRAGEH